MTIKTVRVPSDRLPPANIYGTPKYLMRFRLRTASLNNTSQWTPVFAINVPSRRQFNAGPTAPLDISLINGLLHWETNSIIGQVLENPTDTVRLEMTNSLKPGDQVLIQSYAEYSENHDGIFDVIDAGGDYILIQMNHSPVLSEELVVRTHLNTSKVDIYIQYMVGSSEAGGWIYIGRFDTVGSTPLPAPSGNRTAVRVAVQRPTNPKRRYSENSLFDTGQPSGIKTVPPDCPITICGKVFNISWLS